MVSISSAVALAVSMTQSTLEANGGVLPSTVDFFQPLLEDMTYVPVTPEIEFVFKRDGDYFYDFYDFYFFHVNISNVDNLSVDFQALHYQDIFCLTNAIFYPLTSVTEIADNVWPGNSTGPQKDECLMAKCQRCEFHAFLRF